MVRSENEARIVYTGVYFAVKKWNFRKKFASTLCVAKLLSFHLAALRAAQHGPLHFRFASYAYVLTWYILVSSKLFAFDSMGIHGGVVLTS